MGACAGLAIRFWGREQGCGRQPRGGLKHHRTHLVDVRQDTTAGDRRTDELVELLVSPDGELKVARGDALDAEVLGGVTLG